MGFDATYTLGGRRTMEEIYASEVRNRKIVREEFFYRIA